MLYTPKTRTLKETIQDALDISIDVEGQLDSVLSNAESASDTLNTLKDELAEAQEEVSYLASDLSEATGELNNLRSELEEVLELLEAKEEAHKK